MKLIQPLIAAAVLSIAGVSAQAGAIYVSFDENGNGTWQDTTAASQNGYIGTSGTLTFQYSTDPTGSVAGNVLIYELPELVISGAVDVGEPGDTIGSDDPSPADVLFFTNSSGVGGVDANLLIFYAPVGGGALADSGLPSFAGTLDDVVDLTASGTFQWLPDGATFPNGNEYDGVSTPEPGTFALIGLGVGLIGLVGRRRAAN